MPPKQTIASKKAQEATITNKKRGRSPEKKTLQDISSSTKVAQLPLGNPAKRLKRTANENTTDDGTAEGDSDSVSEEESKKDEEEEESDADSNVPQFTGTFDLYGMELGFLNKAYSLPGKKDVYPSELYKTILTYQAKSDRTAQVTIPDKYAESGQEGTFKSRIFCDPMEEMPFDISLSDFKDVDKTGFKSKYDSPKNLWEGPGIKANMEIEDGGCGISSSSGKFSMQPLWKQVDDAGKILELFEGSFDFKVVYSSMYSRKGHGRGQSLAIPFWAIRALPKK